MSLPTGFISVKGKKAEIILQFHHPQSERNRSNTEARRKMKSKQEATWNNHLLLCLLHSPSSLILFNLFSLNRTCYPHVPSDTRFGFSFHPRWCFQSQLLPLDISDRSHHSLATLKWELEFGWLSPSLIFSFSYHLHAESPSFSSASQWLSHWEMTENCGCKIMK